MSAPERCDTFIPETEAVHSGFFTLSGSEAEPTPEIPLTVVQNLALGALVQLSEYMHRPSGNYEFFLTPGERDEVYHYCLSLADYVLANDIENLILMDRAARPMYAGLTECLKALSVNKTLPQIYFVNPKGFISKEHSSKRSERRQNHYYKKSGDRKESVRKIRSLQDTQDDFMDTYSHLLSRNDKPTLLFDTCLHSGTAIKPVGTMLAKNGFGDLQLGVVYDDGKAVVAPDVSFMPMRPLLGCRPFHLETLTEKTYGSVHSVKSESADKVKNGRRLRYEIKRIVREKLAQEGYIQPKVEPVAQG